jgi:hypothetical protein
MTEPKPAKCHCGSISWERRIEEQRFICASCKRPLWQPIETAPKDDTDVLVLCDHGIISIGSFTAGMWWFEQVTYEKREPIYWMPLPEAPHA